MCLPVPVFVFVRPRNMMTTSMKDFDSSRSSARLSGENIALEGRNYMKMKVR